MDERNRQCDSIAAADRMEARDAELHDPRNDRGGGRLNDSDGPSWYDLRE